MARRSWPVAVNHQTNALTFDSAVSSLRLPVSVSNVAGGAVAWTGGASSDLWPVSVNPVTGALTYSGTSASATVADTFDRADNGSSLGSTSTGAVAWTALNGTWGVSSNRAVSSITGENTAVVDCSAADGTVQVTTIRTAGLQGEAGLAFRFSNNSNGWIVYGGSAATVPGKWTMAKKVAGSFMFITPSTQVSPATGDVLQVVMSGTSLTLKVNGVTVASTTDAFNSTATMHGLRTNPGNGTYAFDDWSFTP